MDDMKKLVERYKQELMEYSKAVRAEPEVRVGFVDVTDPEPNGDTDTKANAQTTAEHVTEPQSEAAVERTPQIIGYGGEDIIAQFNDIFGDIFGAKRKRTAQNSVPRTNSKKSATRKSFLAAAASPFAIRSETSLETAVGRPDVESTSRSA